MSKEKRIRYISHYKNFKFLHKFEKKKSKTAVQFMTDDPEKWLIDVAYFNKKDGKVTDSHVITHPDLQDRIDSLKNKGYEEI